MAAGGLAAILAVGQIMPQPHFVPRIRFVNPTGYDLDVEVTSGSHDGWTPVWFAHRNDTTVAEEIFDVGDTWIFRFEAQGVTSGEVRVTRSELRRDGWQVAVPAIVGDQLSRSGAPLPP